MSTTRTKAAHVFSPPMPTFEPAPIFGALGENDIDDKGRDEIVVFPAIRGPMVHVSFASPFEGIFLLDGARVIRADGDAQRAVALFCGRWLLSLHQALGESGSFCARLVDEGLMGIDLFRADEDAFVDHQRFRAALAPVSVGLPTFAKLGIIRDIGEFSATTQSMFAAGTKLEVRRERAGVVVSRSLYTVGRRQPP